MLKITKYALMLGLAGLTALGAQAQPFPSKPIRIVVPYPAGGASDPIARGIAAELSKRIGQTVFVENRPGGNTIIAVQYVASAAPDGYTLLYTYTNPFTQLPAMYKKLPYDPKTSYTPVALMGELKLGIAVPASSPHTSLTQMVAAAKASPEKVTYGSSGSAQTTALAMALFNTATGIKMTHVPYQGSGPAVQALVAGQVDSLFTDVTSVDPFVKAGRLRLLGVPGPKRNPDYPDVPTFAEQGFKDVEIPPVWFGLVGPPNMPADVVAKLNQEITATVRTPEIGRVLANLKMAQLTGGPQDMAALIATDEKLWGGIIRQLGIQLD